MVLHGGAPEGRALATDGARAEFAGLRVLRFIIGSRRLGAATAIGILSGQRTRPVPMMLISSQVLAARERGLGVSFFYFETLWNTAAEPPETRQSAFQELFPTPALRTLR